MAITQKKDEPRETDDERTPSEPAESQALERSGADSDATDSSPEQGGGETDEGSAVAAQLGVRKYVLAAYFVAGLLVAYIGAQLIAGVWAKLANKEWFATAIPLLASVPDETKMTYATLLSGVLSLVLVIRTYQRPAMQTWSDDVAAELARCKWPTKKEVTNYTTVVLIASALATSYLALLDRFYSFVTNLVYGNGS